MPFDFAERPATTISAPTDEPIPNELLSSGEKWQKRRTRRLIGAQAALLTIVTGVGLYASDVNANREIQASSQASVTVYDEPLDPENNSSAVIFFNGFGTYDADSIAEVFGPGIKETFDGESWSVSYGNAPLNPEKIAGKINALAQERGVSTVSIVGYSAGGIIGVATGAELAKNPDLTIRNITTASTPDGVDGLRPYRQTEIQIADTLGRIPGAKYSTPVRLAGEIYFRRDRFDEGDPLQRVNDFFETAHGAYEHIQQPKLPGTWLLIDQTLAIAESDINANLKKIAAEYDNKKPLPTLLYLGTDKPGRDYMVDDALSGENICNYGRQSNMECSIFNVPGAIHTLPEKTKKEYTATLRGAHTELMRDVSFSKIKYIDIGRIALSEDSPLLFETAE